MSIPVVANAAPPQECWLESASPWLRYSASSSAASTSRGCLAIDAVRAADPALTAVRADEPLRDIALNTFFQVPRPLSSAALLESGLPIYDLRIEPKELRVLQQIAEEVTARNIATGVAREYVPAQFLMDGGWYPIRVKLRGLYDVHYLKTRPSLRLNFPKRRLFHGKKQINLSDPYDKGLTVDATTNWELRPARRLDLGEPVRRAAAER